MKRVLANRIGSDGFCSLWAVLVLCLIAGGLQAQDPNGMFQPAIDSAQKKMVKVYGATAGRVDGYASGVLVSPDGLIVTMQGVYLDGMNTRVVLPDGTAHAATVLRRHRGLQLALLKIESPTPDYFRLSENAVGAQGDWVVTLSNAFKVADGVEAMSVNLGIISLRTEMDARLNARDLAYSGRMVLLDAITSNPGAGGGAAVTVDGDLVGTIGRVINNNETNTRLNYAVPSGLLKQFVDGTLETPERKVDASGAGPADLGLRLFTLGGRGQPAYIDRVLPNSPAAGVGLRPDDLLLSLNGEKIGTVREFESAMKRLQPGQEIIIIVKRRSDLLRIPITAVEKK